MDKERMALFPFFRDIKDKTVVVTGTGKEAESKCEKLAPYGAKIVRLTEHDWGDITELTPLCVIVAGEDREMNRKIALWCRENQILVNTVDDPEYCDFVFPSLIARGNLSVGICTGGASPSAGVLLKQRIEEQIPEHMEEILDWLQAVRPVITETLTDKKQRFSFYHQLAEQCMTMDRPLTDIEFSYMLALEALKQV